jgi:hypothetical protein
MLSPLAEQIVTRLIAGLSSDELDPKRTHAARFAALPIGVSMWADYYLRPCGEVVIVGEDLYQPDAVSIHTDRSKILRMLVWGAKQYPELARLLPVRDEGAVDCPTCRAIPLFTDRKVLCPTCDGLGWLPGEAIG